jgi:hypothetical protein
MVFELLALVMYVPLAVAGLWLLVTGRRMIFGLPKGMKEGWQLRAFGAVYVLGSSWVIYRAIHDGTYAADAIVFAYVALFAVAGIFVYRRRKARRAEAAETLL